LGLAQLLFKESYFEAKKIQNQYDLKNLSDKIILKIDRNYTFTTLSKPLVLL